MKKKKRILFVCLGNICRSSSAEGIMRKLVDEAGLEDAFEISSMGIRVDENSLVSQLKESNCMDRLELEFHKMIVNKEL